MFGHFQLQIFTRLIYIRDDVWLLFGHGLSLLIKKVANFIVGILMSQHFQFMKVNIVYKNAKAVAILYLQKLSVLPQIRAKYDLCIVCYSTRNI